MRKTWSLVLALLLLASGMGFSERCRALEINLATAAELDSLRGVGPGLSTPILTERAREPFKDWPDLIARVKGIGPSNAARFSAQGLTVDGLPFERPARSPRKAPR